MNFRKVLLFAIGPIGSALLALISLPIITWFFTQEDVGKISMFQMAIAISTLVFSLGLDQAYVREFHEVADKPALLNKTLIPGLFVLILTYSFIFLMGAEISYWLFDFHDEHLSLLILTAILFAYQSRFLSLVLRMNEYALAYSLSQLLPKLIFLVIIVGYVFLDVDKNLTNLVIANTIAIFFVFVILALNTQSEWRVGITASLDIKHLKKMLAFGLPLVLGGVAYWGLTAIDKILLRTLASYEELAIYSVGASFASAALVIQAIFSTIWAPIVYKWASKGEGLENVYQVSRYILFLVVVFFCFAGFFSWIVTLFLPVNYLDVQWIVVACLGAPLLYTLSETTVVGICIARRTSFAILAALIAFAVNFVGNWLMIPRFGASGAAVSTCVSFWVFFILRTEFSIYVWKPIPRLLLYGYSALAVLGACIFTLFGPKIYTFMQMYWVLLLLAVFFSFKVELRSIVKFVNEKFKTIYG